MKNILADVKRRGAGIDAKLNGSGGASGFSLLKGQKDAEKEAVLDK